jgi:hypothetical protein
MRNSVSIFKTSDDAGAELFTRENGLKKDIDEFMLEIEYEYAPRWEDWGKAWSDAPPTSPRNKEGQSEHSYYTALVNKGKVLLLEMTGPQKEKFDKLYEKLEACENKKKTAKEEVEGKKGAVDLSESDEDERSTNAEENEIMKEVQRTRKKALEPQPRGRGGRVGEVRDLRRVRIVRHDQGV